jgi:hypothetical protein
MDISTRGEIDRFILWKEFLEHLDQETTIACDKKNLGALLFDHNVVDLDTKQNQHRNIVLDLNIVDVI